MEFKKLENAKIPVLGIGTWGMGGWISADYSHDVGYINAIKTALKVGITHIDTAEVYGNGHAEELIGKAIKGFGRDKLFITSKVYRNHLHYSDVINSAKNSLKRMNCRYIDLYLIHWPNPNIPLKETMRAIDYLVKKKIVKFIGVSNFSLKLLKEAQKCTKNKIVANQVEYNLLKREPEKNLLKYCQEKGIFLIAYQPLAGGKLAHSGFKFLDELAEKYKKTPAQIAINWLISKQNVITIPKASAEHIKEDISALGWKLSKKDAENLGKYFFKFWFISNFIGKPVRFLRDCVMRIIPESKMEKFERFYDSTIIKIKNSIRNLLK